MVAVAGRKFRGAKKTSQTAPFRASLRERSDVLDGCCRLHVSSDYEPAVRKCTGGCFRDSEHVSSHCCKDRFQPRLSNMTVTLPSLAPRLT